MYEEPPSLLPNLAACAFVITPEGAPFVQTIEIFTRCEALHGLPELFCDVPHAEGPQLLRHPRQAAGLSIKAWIGMEPGRGDGVLRLPELEEDPAVAVLHLKM